MARVREPATAWRAFAHAAPHWGSDDRAGWGQTAIVSYFYESHAARLWPLLVRAPIGHQGALEIDAVELGVGQDRARQSRLGKVSAREIGPGEIGAEQVGAGKVRALELGFTHHRID